MTSTIIPFEQNGPKGPAPQLNVFFDRRELQAILDIYGKMVASGHWKDYAMDGNREMALFSVFQRASERPVYQIAKIPKLKNKQGAYAIFSAQGQVLKRGQDLRRMLKYFDRKLIDLVR